MKKILFCMLWMIGTVAFMSAQEEATVVTTDTIVPIQKTCMPIPLSHWSVSIFTGVNNYRLAPEPPKTVDKLHMMIGGTIDYTINPLAGVGLEYTYNDFSRPFIWELRDYTLEGRTNDVILYGTINLSNAFAPFRTGFWKYLNIYGNVGGGIAFFASTSDITSTEYSDYCPVGKIGLNAELSLNNSINLNFGAQYRQYDELHMSGISTSLRNADALIYTVGLRYKIGTVKSNHARNTSLCEYSPKPVPIIINKTYVKGDTDKTLNRLRTIEEENATLKLTVQKMKDDAKNVSIQKSLSTQNAALKQDIQNMEKEAKNTSIQSSLQTQNTSLQQKLQKLETDLKLLATQKEGVVNLSLETIEFKTGSNELAPASTQILDQVAGILKNNSFWSGLKVSGHTDNIGSSESNQRLSESRALAVKEYLLSKGVPASNVLAIGLGENKPVDTNDTPQGRQNNRRVEFEITK